MGDSSKVIAARAFRWEGVPVQEYKRESDLFAGVTRQVLLGQSEGEDALNFELRYFEIDAGGYTTLEQHEHPHAVIVLRGRGTVVLGAGTRRVQPFDCVYISPEVVHQFLADRGETLGFACVVDRVRDPARPVGP